MNNQKANQFKRKFHFFSAWSILFAILCNSFMYSAFSQTTSNGTDVSAQVGDYYLTAGGTIEGQATVILTTSNGQQMATTVALSSGTFSFSQILIQNGFSGFCLKATSSVSFASSTVCFTFPPASSDIIVKDIVIPIQSMSSTPSSQVPVATGYTVPNAIVTIQLPDGTSLKTTADASGYYQFFRTSSLVSLSPTGTFLQTRAGEESSPSISESDPASSATDRNNDAEGDGLSGFVKYIVLGIFLIVFVLLLVLLRKKIARLMRMLKKEPQKKLHHSWWFGY